ncbi:MAG: VIT domain-containing protein [Phycisphaerales bacterium]
MTKWMRAMNLVLAVVVAMLAVWVGGCNAVSSTLLCVGPEPDNSKSAPPAPAPPSNYSPVGVTQNGDLARFESTRDGSPTSPFSAEFGDTPQGGWSTSTGESKPPVNYSSSPSAPPAAMAAKATAGSGPARHERERRSDDQPSALGVIRGSSSWRSGDEIWVIAKKPAAAVAPRDDMPGSGAMICRVGGRTDNVPVPLKHTSVRASVVGPAAKVDVTQTFENPFSEKIEAVYVFPLPENGAVTEFVMTIGERRIRAVVRERGEAERTYMAARAQGYTAALLTQERANIFTQRVANIEPGKKLDVAITYYHAVSEMDGSYQWVFPMVVAPRFNPPSTGGNGVGAVARGDRGASGQRTEIQYLAPNERSGHDIDVRVDLEAGVPLENVRCGSHQVRVQHLSGSRAVVELSSGDRLPNKDMVLEWKVAGGYAKGGLVWGAGRPGPDGANGDNSFVMMLVPPETQEKIARAPLEMVFVVDRSGSMDGAPIAQARAAVRRGLERLKPGDTFQVIDFAEASSKLGWGPLDATAENIARAQQYVSGIDAKGGTYMMTGLRAALAFPHDPKRLRFVTFLTDGEIGNENEILAAEAQNLGETRVFSFGVGSSTNRFLMDRMARLGRGVAAYVAVNDAESDGARVMDRFFDRIERPVLRDVTIDWNGAGVFDVSPSRLPDLFVGRSVIVAGKVGAGGFSRPVRVTGRVGNSTVTMEVQPTQAAGDGGRAVSAIWARQKLMDLEERALVENWGGTQYADSVRRVALENGLVSAFTALIAVDSSVRTAGTSGVSVAVPVPTPEGVRYDTTVTGGQGGGGDGGRRD